MRLSAGRIGHRDRIREPLVVWTWSNAASSVLVESVTRSLPERTPSPSRGASTTCVCTYRASAPRRRNWRHSTTSRHPWNIEVKKMLRSTSYTSGFAGGGADDRDPLTSQPRAGGGRSCAAPETNGGGMDLGYVTERIIAMWFPAVMSRNQCSIFRNRKGCYATNISTLKKSDGQLNWRHPWRGCAVSARTSIPG
ncbi:unnamed protein product [Acanthoscelides obtectus]|uniref:Uncharacterized protein n=1 Tax=Acanthoscelides obtectus TaxID=200917 RepID=A0A9P0P239_ACAOB|nr:unnamed protein product [Acanthoscelides obtectus]CAK1647015.1 hypothetical protein AOBTE_LOCUS15001 [Acanthoscelides obtectus]